MLRQNAIFYCLVFLAALLVPGEVLAQEHAFPMVGIYETIVYALCWACAPFAMFYAGAITLAVSFSLSIASYLTNLLAVALGVWLLWHVVKIFMPFGPTVGISEVFNKIAGKFFLFVFILAFISNWGNVWNYIISPIFNTGIGLSNQMLVSALDVGNRAPPEADRVLRALFDRSFNNNGPTSYEYGGRTLPIKQLYLSLDCIAGMGADFAFRAIEDPTSGGLAANIGAEAADSIKQTARDLVCNVHNVQKIFGLGLALGITSIIYSGSDIVIPSIFRPSSFEKAFAGVINLIVTFLFGTILMVIFFAAIIIFPLYLIDVIFKFAVVVVASPILVGAYLLELTRGWAVSGIKILVGIAATLFFQAVLVGLALVMMIGGLAAIGGAFGGDSINNAAYYGLLGEVSKFGLISVIYTTPFYRIMAAFTIVGILILFLMGKATKLAQEFTGVMIGDMGAKLGSAATVGGAFLGAAALTGTASLAAGLLTGGGSTAATAGAKAASSAAAGAGQGLSSLDSGAGMAGGTGSGGGGAVGGVLSSSNFTPRNYVPGFVSGPSFDYARDGGGDSGGGGSGGGGGAAPSGGGPSPAGGGSGGGAPSSGGGGSSGSSGSGSSGGGGSSAGSGDSDKGKDDKDKGPGVLAKSLKNARTVGSFAAGAVSRTDQAFGNYGGNVPQRPGESDAEYQARLRKMREEQEESDRLKKATDDAARKGDVSVSGKPPGPKEPPKK